MLLKDIYGFDSIVFFDWLILSMLCSTICRTCNTTQFELLSHIDHLTVCSSPLVYLFLDSCSYFIIARYSDALCTRLTEVSYATELDTCRDIEHREEFPFLSQYSTLSEGITCFLGETAVPSFANAYMERFVSLYNVVLYGARE